MAKDPETVISDELISDLKESLSDLRASPTTDDATRKNFETEYTIRLKLLEQLLRNRELLLEERAQVNENESKDRELRLKENASRIEKWANPLTVGIIVAALGLFGNFVNGLWSNLNQRAQLDNQRVTEKIRLENDLIKEAIKPTAEQDRAKSLVFFAKNKLITLDPAVVTSLVAAAGTDEPVPGSSSTNAIPASAKPIAFEQSIVDRIRNSPGLPLGVPELKRDDSYQVLGIILHDAVGPDAAEDTLRHGMSGLPGPLAHWLVKSDGTIVLIAPETQKANHLGMASGGLKNSNTIGVMVSGQPALGDDRQVESLIRLVIDISERWRLPPDRIFSHAEVALPPGRKSDMLQQAPLVRNMVKAARAPKN